MLLTELHPEDVKAALKKRFRSVAAFERSQGLPEKSVNDVLRGRASARVAAAIESALNKPMTPNAESEFSDGSNEPSGAHRLNAEAR